MAKSIKNVKITVIIPTYNRERFLSRTVTSVLNQSFSDFELVVVDDGSTDNTKKIIEGFQKKDSRIKYIWQKNSGGPARPKNEGIKKAKGKYIAFLDSDDEWFPEKLEKQLSLITETKNVGIVRCNFWEISNGKKKKINIAKKTENYFSKILEKCFIRSSSSVMVPSYVIKKIGFFDESFRLADDWDMWIRILKRYNFDFVEEPLFNYYVHSQNISGDINSVLSVKDNINIIKKYKKYYSINKTAKSSVLRYIGTYYLIRNSRSNAKKYFLRAVKAAPFYYRNYINLAIFFLGNKIYKIVRRKKRRFL